MKEYMHREIECAAHHIAQCAELSVVPEERLYLAVVGIVYYLQAKPDMLRIIDRLRHCGQPLRRGRESTFASPVFRAFARMKKADGTALVTKRDTEWILFLIAGILIWHPCGKEWDDIQEESLRILFNFIAGGIEG